MQFIIYPVPRLWKQLKLFHPKGIEMVEIKIKLTFTIQT